MIMRHATTHELIGVVCKLLDSHGFRDLATQLEEAAEAGVPENIPLTDIFFGENWASLEEAEAKPLTLQPLPKPNEGALLSIKEFMECVNSGEITNYDGTGYYATNKGYSRNHPAVPSEMASGVIDKNWTAVVWFNK